MSNRKPDAWVVCGDVDYTPEDAPANWKSVTTNEDVARYWTDECCLRVRPVYLGEPLNRPTEPDEKS